MFLRLLLTNAILSIRSKLKASIANTLKTPLRVHTAAIATHHPIHNALINICRKGEEEGWALLS